MKRSSFLKGMLSVSALSLLGERVARAASPSVILRAQRLESHWTQYGADGKRKA